ncbi:MAG: hypothetical protein ACPIOQ_15370 [Promethearchaeia archaeon]|jgi:hypothetical protein
MIDELVSLAEPDKVDVAADFGPLERVAQVVLVVEWDAFWAYARRARRKRLKP